MADALTMLIQAVPSLAKLGSEIVSASGSAKANAQLIEFQSALIGLQSLIASVQQENATLTREKREAEEELERMKEARADQARYQLATPYTGIPVYALKKEMSNGEAPHYLCANCFQQGKRSFIQHSKNKERWVALSCAVCRFSGETRFRGVGPDKYAEDLEKPQ